MAYIAKHSFWYGDPPQMVRSGQRVSEGDAAMVGREHLFKPDPHEAASKRGPGRPPKKRPTEDE